MKYTRLLSALLFGVVIGLVTGAAAAVFPLVQIALIVVSTAALTASAPVGVLVLLHRWLHKKEEEGV